MQSHPESGMEVIHQRVYCPFCFFLLRLLIFLSSKKMSTIPIQSRDPFVIFSGGLPQDRPGRSASITVVHGRNTTVLEMEHNVVDFVALCDTPWASG